jgi:hypothetical protein
VGLPLDLAARPQGCSNREGATQHLSTVPLRAGWGTAGPIPRWPEFNALWAEKATPAGGAPGGRCKGGRAVAGWGGSRDRPLQCLRRLLEDPALASTLVSRGRERAAVFSNQSIAERTYAIYRDLLRPESGSSARDGSSQIPNPPE